MGFVGSSQVGNFTLGSLKLMKVSTIESSSSARWLHKICMEKRVILKRFVFHPVVFLHMGLNSTLPHLKEVGLGKQSAADAAKREIIKCPPNWASRSPISGRTHHPISIPSGNPAVASIPRGSRGTPSGTIQDGYHGQVYYLVGDPGDPGDPGIPGLPGV